MEENKTMNIVNEEVTDVTEETTGKKVNKITDQEKNSLNKHQMEYNQCLIEIGDLELSIDNLKERKETMKSSFSKTEGEFNNYLELLKAKYDLENEQITGEFLKEKVTEDEFETLSKHKTETSDILLTLGDVVVSLDTLEKRMKEAKEKLVGLKSNVEQFLQTIKYKYNLDNKARINFNTGEIL